MIRVTRADRGDLALSFELGFNSVGALLLILEYIVCPSLRVVCQSRRKKK